MTLSFQTMKKLLFKVLSNKKIQISTTCALFNIRNLHSENNELFGLKSYDYQSRNFFSKNYNFNRGISFLLSLSIGYTL